MSVSSDAVYCPIEGVENLERYRPGGYHPVALGATLSQSRYVVVDKLGHGGYSTVWLARDGQQARFVAVKVVLANSPPTNERDIRQRLARAKQNHPGACFVQQLLGSFFEQGPNGTHECLVSVPGGMSVQNAKSHPCQYEWLFPLDVSRAIAAQMILATSFVHSQGIVHGDLHLGNFLVQLPRTVLGLTTEQYLREYPPATQSVTRYDGQPLTASAPAKAVYNFGVGNACHEMTLADARILLTDFGSSWMPSKTRKTTLETILRFLPPEYLFAEEEKKPFGPAVDTWTLAHSIFNLFARTELYADLVYDKHDVFAKAIEILGRPPARWWNSWSARGEFFNANGDWAPQPPRVPPYGGTLEDRIIAMRRERTNFDMASGASIDDSEAADMQAMLRSMLEWEPNARATSTMLTGHSWMRKWGLPAMNKALAAAKNA